MSTDFFLDLPRELAVTRTVLAALPTAHFEWTPHPKSMTLRRLAQHVAELPDWIRGTLEDDVMDVTSAPRPPENIHDTPALIARFDHNVARLNDAVAHFDPARLAGNWTMKNGSETIVSRPRPVVYRIWCLNHLIHHRAQLALYLRLLNTPVPTIYFNTADNPEWVFE